MIREIEMAIHGLNTTQSDSILLVKVKSLTFQRVVVGGHRWMKVQIEE